MEPKIWLLFSIIFVCVSAIVIEVIDWHKFNPESLPPPAAGITDITRYTCEDVIYSISEDGIKYVRESGGGTLLAAKLNNKIGLYQLGRYGDVINANDAEIYTEASKKLEYALANCDEKYMPTGVNFTLR